eukprot:6172774-Pleurochrysis_carterae.AAC.5
MATSVLMAAAFDAAQLSSEAGSAGTGCAPTWEPYEWTEEEEETIKMEADVGKVVASEQTAYANQGRVAAGVVLYCIMWQGYPPDMV